MTQKTIKTLEYVHNVTEAQARQLNYCPACDDSKSVGMVVCWSCWRESYKKYSGTFREWLQQINEMHRQAFKEIEK